jgi:hypothetical protein
MHREIVMRLIERCKMAERTGIAREEIQSRLLPDEIERLIEEIDAQDFIERVKEDQEYSYYYYDAQQSGVCAKPREALALILESITLDALE